ncbi:serine/threonine-protein kinase BLUS1-like [Apium graveolens]|uniref:serine/threonine-protein kinase BLUS1-like n=1 Tax=Apium graveolens TaxID=4045 RepID=UPI003D790B04
MKPPYYLADSKAYKLVDKVGSSYYWSLYKAVYDHGDDHDNNVSIKIFDFNQKEDMYPVHSIIKEIFQAKKCCQHANIVRSVHCSFKKDNHLCVVLPNPKKPLPSFAIFKHGLPEEIVAFVIMETLKALDCMHETGERVHGNLSTTNVFLDEEANVKLEFPSWLINPEVVENPSSDKKNKKSDFRMVGTLAYDLFNGTSPAKKKLPALLEDFVKFCGSSRGPDTIHELMSHPFLKEFCHLDQYTKDLKKLLTRKLHPKRISCFFVCN